MMKIRCTIVLSQMPQALLIDVTFLEHLCGLQSPPHVERKHIHEQLSTRQGVHKTRPFAVLQGSFKKLKFGGLWSGSPWPPRPCGSMPLAVAGQAEGAGQCHQTQKALPKMTAPLRKENGHLIGSLTYFHHKSLITS